MTYAGDRVVVKIEVRDLKIFGNRFLIHRKSMILRRDLNFAVGRFLDRLVCTAMAEFQFERLRTASQ